MAAWESGPSPPSTRTSTSCSTGWTRNWRAARFAALLLFMLFLLLRERRRGRGAADPRAAAFGGMLAEMEGALRRRRIAREPGRTLNSFAALLRARVAPADAARELADWFLAYAALRYGGTPPDRDGGVADLRRRAKSLTKKRFSAIQGESGAEDR